MSMRYYGVEYYALVLNNEDIEPLMSPDDNDDICTTAERLGFECEGNFTGEILSLKDDGYNNYSKEINYLDDDYFFYFELNNYSTLFTKAYKNFDEIILELKLKLKDILPQDFDYRNHIKHIIGTVLVE